MTTIPEPRRADAPHDGGNRAAFFPVNLCLHQLPVALIGRGHAFAARYRKLLDAGASGLRLFGEAPPEGLRLAEGDRFEPGYPPSERLRSFRLVMLAEAPEEETLRLAAFCRAEGILVNAEDVIPWCDFYFMSSVRRGDLVLAAGTGGAGPTLAVMIREFLEEAFPEAWAARLTEAAELRLKLRAEGASKAEVIAAMRALLKPLMPAVACGECPRVAGQTGEGA